MTRLNAARPLMAGKTVVVTGANRGLGKAIARVFAWEGATTILLGRDRASLEKARSDLAQEAGAVEICVCDLSHDDRIYAAVEEMTGRFGVIDCLVNNAGIETDLPFMEMPMDMFDDMMRFNFRQLAVMTRAVLPGMIARGSGNVINISSAAGERGLPTSTAYSASKAAVITFTHTLGEEMRPHGVRVNCLNPGLLDTELFWESATRDYLLERCGDIISLDTVGYTAVFLASDLSEGISCQSLTVRGISRW
jgi:3-oxoacyl-[acyl-carrier protein] reductase